jgi:hypothetical protein
MELGRDDRSLRRCDSGRDYLGSDIRARLPFAWLNRLGRWGKVVAMVLPSWRGNGLPFGRIEWQATFKLNTMMHGALSCILCLVFPLRVRLSGMHVLETIFLRR